MKIRFVALLLAMVAAVGCAAAGQETTAGEETTTGHTGASSAPPPQKTQEEAPEAKTQMQANGANDDADKHILRCQVDEAAQDNGKDTKQGQFIDEVYQESRERGVDPEQVLSERGYDCGWSALQQSEGKG